MAAKIDLASYIFTRLRQLGVHAVHGVPGDFTLRALDLIPASGLRWIGNCNELNAGYAADGYARVRGISALFTTYGVGELSALNAVAGSFAEHVPVVHLVGTPARALQKSRALVHHSLGDGNLGIYAELYKHFTVAQANLNDVATACEAVDDTLQQCLSQSKPVYIGLPSDMVAAQVDSAGLENNLSARRPQTQPGTNAALIDTVIQKLHSAKRPLILVDGLTRRHHLADEANELARITGFPTMTLPFGNGIVENTLDNYHGVYAAQYGRYDYSEYVKSCDLVLLFGAMLSDTNTVGWAAVPPSDATITFCADTLDMESSSHALHTKDFVQEVIARFDPASAARNVDTSFFDSAPRLKGLKAVVESSEAINQDTFWLRMSSYLRSGDILLLANGTPLVGQRDFVLPARTMVIASGLWLSVGSMLPAAQGAALARTAPGAKPGRTILFEGDGSFQATAQELSTIIRYKLDVTIFIVNNSGYTFERLIHGMNAEYNDIAPWRYLEAASFMGAPTDKSYAVQNHRVATYEDLDVVLRDPTFQKGEGLNMVEVIMAPHDMPEKAKVALQKAGQQLLATPV